MSPEQVADLFIHFKLGFEYQTKERKEAINEFIKKSKSEYDEFFQQLLEDSRKEAEEKEKGSNNSFNSNKNQSNSSSSYSFTPYRSPSKKDDDDPYNAKDYSIFEIQTKRV